MYCSIKHLAGAKSSLICKALRKYGHSLFSFGVLEYCDKKDIYIREQYYIDTLNPEYNISRVAGSPLGVIRSKETKAKIAAARSGCMHSVETKTKISVGVFGRKHTEQALIKMSPPHAPPLSHPPPTTHVWRWGLGKGHFYWPFIQDLYRS